MTLYLGPQALPPFFMAREAALDFMVDLFLAQITSKKPEVNPEIEYWARPVGDVLFMVLKSTRLCPSCGMLCQVFAIGKERAACKKCFDFSDCGDLGKAA